MARLMIGGGNFRAGEVFMDEQDRLRRAALAAQAQNQSSWEAQQRLALQQAAQQFEQGQAQADRSLKLSQIGAQMRNQYLQDEENRRRFDLERDDKLNMYSNSRTDKLSEDTYRRSQDAISRADFLNDRDYKKSRDGVLDERWTQQQQDQNRRYDEDRARLSRADQERALDRDEQARLRADDIARRTKADQMASDDRRLSSTMNGISLRIRSLERDQKLAIDAGRPDLAAQLDAQIAALEEQAAAAQSPAGMRSDFLADDSEMTIGPRGAGPATGNSQSVRQQLAADAAKKAAEKKTDKARGEEVKRQDDFVKDVTLKNSATSAESFIKYVQSEATKRNMGLDDPAVQRALEANPTAREIVQAERELAGQGPVGILEDVQQALAKINPDELRKRNVNAAEYRAFLEKKAAAAQAAIAKAEKKTGGSLRNAPGRFDDPGGKAMRDAFFNMAEGYQYTNPTMAAPALLRRGAGMAADWLMGN